MSGFCGNKQSALKFGPQNRLSRAQVRSLEYREPSLAPSYAAGIAHDVNRYKIYSVVESARSGPDA